MKNIKNRIIYFAIAIVFIIAAYLFINRDTIFAKTNYENKPLGYTLRLTEKFKIDNSKEEIFTKFESEDMDVIVFYDNFENNKDITYENLNAYGNVGIANSKQFRIVQDDFLDNPVIRELTNLNVRLTKYERDKIEKIENDKNNYITITIPRNEKEVYTLMIKTTKPYYDYMKIVSEFKLTEKEGSPVKHKTKSLISERNLNDKTRDFIDTYLLNSDKKTFGLYEEDMEKGDQSVNFEFVENTEAKFDYDFKVLLSYSSTTVFQDGFGPQKQKLFEEAKKRDKVLEMTLSTFEDGPAIEEQNDKTLEILAGKHDDFLKEYADNFKKYENPILLRINNEMNGDWVSYCTFHLGKDPDLFIAAFRYIHDFFDKEGVDNVLYVFNPNEKSFPDFSYNKYLAYYPGDEYVDIVGLTAYNTGTYYDGEIWRSFDEAYRPLYDEYDQRFDQPFMITEFSSSSIGGDKAEWFRDMFEAINNYPKLNIAVLWNYLDWDYKDGEKIPARPYNIDENEEVIEAVKEGLAKHK